jgi:acetylglutamate kinase
MADGKEIRQYLKLYADPNHKRLAVIKVGGAIIRDNLDVLGSAISFLYSVGLTPIIIHGSGPQIDAALESAGIDSVKKNGLRVTDKKSISIIRNSFLDTNLKLLELLDHLGVPATPVTSGVFTASHLDEEKYGQVGQVDSVDIEPVKRILAMNRIPLLLPMGESEEQQILNINADTAANQLIRQLKPHKVVFLTQTGGVLNGEGQIIDTINLASDLEMLMGESWLNQGMRLKVNEIADLLEHLPHASSVSITSPEELAKELFTYQGSGTLIKKGEAILHFTNKKQINLSALTKLIEDSFDKKLKPNYANDLEVSHVFHSENYRAVAIFSHLKDNVWLDKFAVADDAQGEGLGRTIWRHMTDEFSLFFWRAKFDNPIRNFYLNESDGHVNCGKWTVFWKGEFDLTKLPELINEAVNKPASFE